MTPSSACSSWRTTTSACSRERLRVLGKEALGNLQYGVWAMREAKYITDHEVTIGRKLAYVLSGGDGPPRDVSEQDILDLEREAFLSLLGYERNAGAHRAHAQDGQAAAQLKSYLVNRSPIRIERMTGSKRIYCWKLTTPVLC